MSETKAHKTTLEGTFSSDPEQKFEISCFKIDQMASVFISKFRRARRAYFLIHALQILVGITFEEVLMTLLDFFNICDSFIDSENQ